MIHQFTRHLSIIKSDYKSGVYDKNSTRCVDYVILHELCHIAEHNHSERFYRLMNQVMPQWEKIKSKLDGLAARVF